MRCNEFRSLTDLYTDGNLPNELVERVEKHLLICSQCAGEVRSLEQVRALLSESIPVAGSTASFRDRTIARLHHELEGHLRAAPSVVDSRQWILPLYEK